MKTILIFFLVAFGMINSEAMHDGFQATSQEEGEGQPSSISHSDGLSDDFQNQAFMLDQVYRQFAVEPLSMEISLKGYPGETVNLQLRKLGKPREELSLQEVTLIKEAIYKAIGKRFSLEIKTKVIPKEPEFVGNITEINAMEHRVLIVNTDNYFKNGQKPEAYWLKLEADTVIKSGNRSLTFDAMKVGDWLNVWTTGAVELSYPAQTTALEVQVAEPQDVTPLALTTIMKTDLKEIGQIDILFGDGKRWRITDEETIAGISDRLQAIVLVPARDQRSFIGSLYTMQISIGSEKYQYGSSLTLHGLKYRPNEKTQEFNDYLISTARTHIPNLLSGIK